MPRIVDGKYYHPQQAAYAKKYLQQFEKLEVRIPKGEKAEYKRRMKEVGYTNMSAFILNAMEYYFDYLAQHPHEGT